MNCCLRRDLWLHPCNDLVDNGSRRLAARIIGGDDHEIRQLCRDGIGVIVTSSELPELLILCDRILVLCEGRLTGEFSRAEATEQKIMEAATQRELVA